MNYQREPSKDVFLTDTTVENIFINEFMTLAPGDYLKIYLYGLYHAQTMQSMEDEQLAKVLNVDLEVIGKAWKYWEEMGVVRRRFLQDKKTATIEFVNLKETMYGSPKKSKPQNKVDSVLSDKTLGDIISNIEGFLGRTLAYNESMGIIDLYDKYAASAEVFARAIDYCKEKGKSSLNYILATVQGWLKDGLDTREKIDEELAKRDARYIDQKRIIDYLGFNRLPSEPERNYINKWLDQYDFSLDEVLKACEKTVSTSKPSIKYVDAILTRQLEEKGGKSSSDSTQNNKKVSQRIINDYYTYLRDERNKLNEKRRMEVHEAAPDIEKIDNDIDGLNKEILEALGRRLDKKAIDDMKAKMDNLLLDRAFLMTENGFAPDYTEVEYKCKICKDTGMTNEGNICSCYGQRALEAQNWYRQNQVLATSGEHSKAEIRQ